MPVVGAYARVEIDAPEIVRGRLERLEGVDTFDLGDPSKVGLVLEADDLDRAHALLTRTVRSVEGVLGVWPISVHLDDDDTAGEHDEDRAEHGSRR